MATATRRIEDVTITGVERRTNSRNGNPMYKIHTDAGTYLSQTDASMGYGIESLVWSEWRGRHNADLVIGNPAAPRVTLLATPTGRVWGIERDGRRLA